MRLRIACDLDGTIADMDAALQREAEALFGPGVDVRAAVPLPDIAAPGLPAAPEPAAPPARNLGRPLTKREVRTLWDHVRGVKNFWLSLAEIEPGAVQRLGDLAKAHGWELIFLTQRPSTAGLTAQMQSQMWLRRHGFRLPSVFVMQGSRGKVAQALALNLLIDDRVENCMDVITDSTATPVLVWRGSPESIPAYARHMGFPTVASIAEALDALASGTLRPAERQREPAPVPDVSST